MPTATTTAPNAQSIQSPFVVVIDSREQQPFEFFGVRADAKDDNRPINVRTRVAGLKSGDYSIEGYESQIAVERKSFADLFSSLGQGRTRFEAELARLNEMEFAAVAIEASWRDLAYHQPLHSRMSSKSVVRSIFAFAQRYPRVHWFPMGNRALAEVTTFRLLERFWRDKQEANRG